MRELVNEIKHIANACKARAYPIALTHRFPTQGPQLASKIAPGAGGSQSLRLYFKDPGARPQSDFFE